MLKAGVKNLSPLSRNLQEPAPAEAEPEGAGGYAPCPVKEGALILKFSAVLKIETEGIVLRHVLDDGILNLGLVESEGPVYQVYTIEPTTIPYTLSGTMDDCSLQGEGTMRPEASGTCQNGLLRLTIVEDWSQVEGTVTCDGETSPLPPMPALGKMVHNGADGLGEIFPLDPGFSEAGPGYTSIRPFQQGEGEHIWTVFVDPYFAKPQQPEVR